MIYSILRTDYSKDCGFSKMEYPYVNSLLNGLEKPSDLTFVFLFVELKGRQVMLLKSKTSPIIADVSDDH